VIGFLCLIVLFAAMTIAFGRLLRGPELADRSLAFDVIASALVVSVIVLGLNESVPHAFVIFLTVAFLAFLGALALAVLIERTGSLMGLEQVEAGPEKDTTEAPHV